MPAVTHRTTVSVSISVSVLVAAAVVLGAVQVDTAAALRVVRLRNAFISKYKNRATIENLDFRVEHVKQKVNSIGSGGEDGDAHMSGRPGSEVALPMVAEIVNAGLNGTGGTDSESHLAFLKAKPMEGTSTRVTITGFWRLWFEHPPSDVVVQGHTVPIPADTNPDHIFEVHPLLAFDGLQMPTAFVPVPGYTAYTATRAFGAYEAITFRVKKMASFTTISSTTVGFNYTEFDAELAGTPVDVNDAIFALARVLDKKNGTAVTAAPRRLVFAKGTAAANTFLGINPKKGTAIRVLGIPRVNLDQLMDEAQASPGEEVAVRGTYEIIIVGIR
jgi:hypothetical protein